jgi:two-component system, NarL family, capsular synthesis sensor histidine kinase RcsC
MRELWLSNQTLEQKVSERTAALDRSLTALEKAGRSKLALLRELGHELATPLHAISGHLELLSTNGLEMQERDRIAQARASVVQLDGVLQALLALSSIPGEPDRNLLETRLPTDVVDELVGRWQLPAARHGQLLVATLDSPDEQVTLCWMQLIVAIDAIVDACVQFAAPGRLELYMTVTDEIVSVSFEDNGPPLEHHSSIALPPTPLVWASAGRRGIGLAVAQQVSEQVGASLEVTVGSSGNVRSVFSLPRPYRLLV